MVQTVLENLQSRQIEVKTGEVNPGDVAAVIASNRKLEPQAFGMKWGYSLPDGKLIFNTRSETAAKKAMFSDGIRQRRCLIPADYYYEWQKTGQGKQKYKLALGDADGFFLAGIYRIEQGRPVLSILTKEPVDSSGIPLLRIYWKKMLISGIFNSCLGIHQSQQQRFILMSQRESKRIFLQRSTQETK